jgi:hypothetical protein
MRLDFEGATMPKHRKRIVVKSQKGKCFNLILNGIEIKIVWLEMKGILKGWICKEGRLKGFDLKGSEFEKV